MKVSWHFPLSLAVDQNFFKIFFFFIGFGKVKLSWNSTPKGLSSNWVRIFSFLILVRYEGRVYLYGLFKCKKGLYGYSLPSLNPDYNENSIIFLLGKHLVFSKVIKFLDHR